MTLYLPEKFCELLNEIKGYKSTSEIVWEAIKEHLKNKEKFKIGTEYKIISISISEENRPLIERATRVFRERGYTSRSELFRDAIRQYLRKNKVPGVHEHVENNNLMRCDTCGKIMDRTQIPMGKKGRRNKTFYNKENGDTRIFCSRECKLTYIYKLGNGGKGHVEITH